MKLDDINWKILKSLQKNARQSNTDIAKQVNITSPAVAERIRKMEDLGIIQGYHAKVSHYETGHQLKAIITLRAFMGRLKPFLETVKSFDEVVNCYRITGNENIVMEVVLNNLDIIYQLSNEVKLHISILNLDFPVFLFQQFLAQDPQHS